MRQAAVVIVLFLVVAACSDEPATETSGSDGEDTIELSTSTTTTEGPTTTTTSDLVTTTTESAGMCGDLVPVVTAGGTRCIDPDAPVTWDVDPAWFEPVAGDIALPPMIGGDWKEVFVFDMSKPYEERYTPLRRVDGEVGEVRMMSDGSFVVQERYTDEVDEFWPEVRIYHPDGTFDPVPGATELYDLVWLDGRQLAVVGVLDVDGANPIRTFDVDSLEWIGSSLGTYSESEYYVTNVDVAAGLVVQTVVADLTEWVRFLTTDGVDVDLPSPTDTLGYNAPPYVTAASFTPDASVLLWAEGPDWDGAAEEQTEGPWYIEAVDIATGDTVLGWQVTDVDVDDDFNVVSTHHTGDFVIVNFDSWVTGDRVTGRPFAIDLRGEEPEEWRLDFTGIISPIDPF